MFFKNKSGSYLLVIAAFGTNPVAKGRPAALFTSGEVDLLSGQMGSSSSHL